MEFSVLKSDIEKLAHDASRFASSRSQLPILENIVLRAKGTHLTALATNLEVSFFGFIGAKVIEEGEIAIPARILTELTNKIKIERIDFKTDGETVKVSGEEFSATIMGMNTSDFPMIPEKEDLKSVVIGFSEFISGLSKVMFSVSRDDTRPVLTGVLVLIDTADYLTLVASDGFRLSKKKVGIKSGEIEADNIIIPKLIFNELMKLSGEFETINFSYIINQNQVIFKIGNYIISSRLIEGNFPDFNKIIPESTKTSVFMGKEEFSDAISTAGIFARDSANVIKMDVSSGKVKIISESSRSGAQESNLVAKVEGFDQLVSFNFRYIEEFLGVCAGKEVTIKLIDSNSPGVFVDGTDINFLHIIMPVRMEE